MISARSTFCCRVVLLLAALLSALPGEALPVHVAFVWPTGRPANTISRVHIQALRIGGNGDGGTSLEAEISADGAVLNLSDGVWQVHASAPGYWSQGSEVDVTGRTPEDVQLVFWPAASLHAEMVLPEGESLPSEVEVQLNAFPASRETESTTMPVPPQEAGPSHAQLHCRIEAGAWSCLGPAGLFDVRLEVAGYAPRYEWGVVLQPAKSADLGRIELRRSASVFGRVVRKDGSDPPGPCRATLRPDMARRGPTEADEEAPSGPDGKTRLSVVPNSRGYFQIMGVPPGAYSLFIGCRESSAFRELRVEAYNEARIDPPLLLEDLSLQIGVTPYMDPAGQAWQIALDETAPHFLRIMGKAMTAADGRWIRHGLMAGNYHVVVRSSDGTVWLQKYFDLSKSSATLSLRIGSVSVSGRVTMSSQPVRARLKWTNDAGGESVTLASNDNGLFHGLLPDVSGEHSSWTVEANLVKPPLTQRLLNVTVPSARGSKTAWLDLDLPAVPVHGIVTSPTGKPEPNVQVTFEGPAGTRTTTGTDDAGRFEMLDLLAGKYTATAESYDGSSDRVRFEITEGGGSELKLVLTPYKRYSFYVVSPEGPVANATVQVWIAPGMPRAFVHTDENGLFDVSFPPEIAEAGFTVGAPGYATKLTRLAISSGGNEAPEARTISLDTTGGTLVLNFHAPGRPVDNSGMLYLVHNRAIQDVRTIAGWGTNQAGLGNNANGSIPVTVDAIEPGDYALCVITDSSQVAAIWSGTLPSDRCSTGRLDADETLTLSPC